MSRCLRGRQLLPSAATGTVLRPASRTERFVCYDQEDGAYTCWARSLLWPSVPIFVSCS